MSSLAARDVRPSGTTLRLAPGQMDRLRAHAAQGYPHEIVGILAGDRAALRVTRAVPLVNERAADARTRYQVDGLLLMRAEQRLEAEGLEVVGYYHSHPDHPAMYSDTDRDLALPGMSYLIVSVRGAAGGPAVAEARSWRLREDREQMDEEAILVEDP